jgi:hypothetical protein
MEPWSVLVRWAAGSVGGEVNGMPAFGQGDRNSGSDGGLPDAALAHAHHEPVTVELQFVHQGSQRRSSTSGDLRCVISDTGTGSGHEQGLKCRDADHIARFQIQYVARQTGDRPENDSDGCRFPGAQGPRQLFLAGGFRQDSVDDDVTAPIPIWLSSR